MTVTLKLVTPKSLSVNGPASIKQPSTGVSTSSGYQLLPQRAP